LLKCLFSPKFNFQFFSDIHFPLTKIRNKNQT